MEVLCHKSIDTCITFSFTFCTVCDLSWRCYTQTSTQPPPDTHRPRTTRTNKHASSLNRHRTLHIHFTATSFHSTISLHLLHNNFDHATMTSDSLHNHFTFTPQQIHILFIKHNSGKYIYFIIHRQICK